MGAERVYKVVFFGVIGTGKSSIINLLADEQVAAVSTSVEPCTRRARWYPISLEEKKFRLWDTMGFNPVEAEDIDPLSPYEQAHALLRNLPDGVDLIVLCARTDRISASLRKLYLLLRNFFFGGQVKIALVLTCLDTIPEQERLNWWDKNMNDIAQKSTMPLQSLPHACITTVYDVCPQSDPLYQRSKQALEGLLKDVYSATPTPIRLDLSSSDVAAERLRTYCQLSIRDATKLVEKFKSPQRPSNVVLFGESGAGKSSVINLLLGCPGAKVSPNIDSCTLDFCGYTINTGLHQFRVWDTVGLNGMYTGDNMCGRAIENAARLIRNLHNEGGVDMLVLCKRYGRFLSSELNNFRLFYEFLCEGQIPVAFIITHLESLNPMEKWWETNGEGVLKACALKSSAVAGHACITSQALDDPNDQGLCDKLSLSRQLVQTMLEDSTSYGNAFNKDQETWVVSFLKRLVGMMIKAGNPPRKDKVTVRSLVERCGLSKNDAEELINSFYTRG